METVMPRFGDTSLLPIAESAAVFWKINKAAALHFSRSLRSALFPFLKKARTAATT
jgi:hypothetical protein